MKTEEFNSCLAYMQKHTVDVLTEKAKEYATDDRLHNFKAAAALQRETPGESSRRHDDETYSFFI